jgi:UDP-N-acetyl-D-mannosaminuronic acid dehydrogenase
MPIHLSDLVENALRAKGISIQDSTITVLGLAYLEDSDDTRNTPAATFIASLQAKGAEVRLHDPYVQTWEFTNHTVEREIIEAAKGSDCIALVTKHSDYYSLDLDAIKQVMRTPIIVDGRNVFNRKEVESKGFEYRAIGKKGILRPV